MLRSSKNEIKKHMNIDHKYTKEVSQEVCYHYRQGNCFKVNSVMQVTKKATLAPHGNKAQQKCGHQHAPKEMAAPGWHGEPAGISIRGWGCRGSPRRSLLRGPSIGHTKQAAEARVAEAEALADMGLTVSERKHVGFLTAQIITRVFPLSQGETSS